MSKRSPRLVLLSFSLFVLASYGCRSAGDRGPRIHTPPTDVVVHVSQPPGGGTAVATPETAVLEHPSQKLIWTSCDGELTITWDNNPGHLPPVRCEQGTGRGHCVVTIPPGRPAKHSYSITVTPFAAKSASFMIDPHVIVEY